MQTVSADESGQRIMGNEVFDGVACNSLCGVNVYVIGRRPLVVSR